MYMLSAGCRTLLQDSWDSYTTAEAKTGAWAGAEPLAGAGKQDRRPSMVNEDRHMLLAKGARRRRPGHGHGVLGGRRMIKGVEYVTLFVADVERSLRFYHDLVSPLPTFPTGGNRPPSPATG
ncbi:hypothetical protein LIP_2313 [Limnochorda pilosa]|uniref:Uncharacterized protein n=1 Tax=Limnochorda pilosa TaxID=1555112 RepID=A0A0K2SMX6_LIMPI|nr:hypothetical protein LIP_2313 [Limnochorda pilosa]